MTHQISPIPPSLSKEAFINSNRVKTNAIYLVILVAITTVIILLPILKISISVQGSGIIRPVSEKAEIKAIQSELVESIFIQEGLSVNKGDTLIILRQDILQSKIEFLNQEQLKQQIFINDLEGLTNNHKLRPKSSVYLGQYNSYRQNIYELDSKIIKSKKEINRNKTLYEKEIISEKEYEDLLFNQQQLKKEKDILESKQFVQWTADIEEFSTGLNDIKKQLEELEKQRQFYVITSPVSGTIEEFSGIYSGSMLQTGQTITVISPQSEKIAEVYISAKDIGNLYIGQKTIIQVDAFDYNQWGVLNGTIIEISDDFILADNTPVFNVKCKLEYDVMKLKNGVKGNIKKGMTVNARFMIARRSLFQLLYQKSDDWLNPSRSLISN